MCLEYSNVNFGYQGAMSASQCKCGTTYGVTRLAIVSVQSFKAVTSIVWVGGPKVSNVLCMLKLEHTHRDWLYCSRVSSLSFVLYILFHILCFPSCHKHKEKSFNIAQTASILH